MTDTKRRNKSNLEESDNSDSSLDKVSKNNSINNQSEDQICIICAENIQIASLSKCNHKVCHKCSFRNVALYTKSQCLVCRTDVTNLIYTENVALDKFDALKESDLIPSFKGDLGIRYTSEYAKDETLKLLEYTCPIKSCSFHGRHIDNFKELNNHVKDVHNKFYCELCVKFKKAFISELKYYNKKQLHHHQTKGDDIGFKGHPECKFCSNKRFYSDDELFVHMRENHEKCHICQQIDPNNPQYFRNYDHLAQHFSSAHYTCNVQSCLDQKFVVFIDEFDLQTHMAKEHAGLYGNNILFNTNTFNNQLYTVPNNKKKNKNPAGSDQSNTDNYELKKKRLEERAKHYLNYSQENFDRFLAVNIEYSNGDISAENVIERYHDIFRQSKDVDYDLLVYELSGLFPSKSQLRKDLEEINKPQLQLRDMKEKYPSLPGIGGSTIAHLSSWGDNSTSRSSSKLKLSNSGAASNSRGKKSSRNALYDMPALPMDDTPVFSSNSWVTPSSSSSRIKTRGISSNSTPINAYSIPGYNPVESKSKTKTKNPWNSTKNVSSINPGVTSNISSNKLSGSSSSSINSISSSISSKSSRAISYVNNPPKKVSAPVDERLFPSLPKEAPKKVIPRVNPINNAGGVWGGVGSASSTDSLDNNGTTSGAFDLDVIGTSLKSVKKGKKGKKVVYHIGL